MRCIVLVCVVMLCTGACTKQTEHYRSSVFVMGTHCSVRIYTSLGRKKAEAVLQLCTDRLHALERHLTIHGAEHGICSTVMTINKNAGLKSTVIPQDIRSLFTRSFFLARLTEGAFNPCIGSITQLWNIGFEYAHVPDMQSVAHALKYTVYTDVVWTEKGFLLKEKEMVLDFGGIAKGFAADELAGIITAEGILSAVINIGGTVFSIGSRPDGMPWSVGIQSPRHEPNPVGALNIMHKAVSTSGGYERYFEQNGRRYHHIFNPTTGFPVENDILSVSVIADSAADADALSTACFVLGYRKSLSVLAAVPHTQAVFIFKNNTVRTIALDPAVFRILNPAYRY